MPPLLAIREYILTECLWLQLHPTCPAAEREHITAALAAEVVASDAAAAAAAARPGGEQQETPVEHSEWSCAIYRRMARSKPVWAICSASLCHNIVRQPDDFQQSPMELLTCDATFWSDSAR